MVWEGISNELIAGMNFSLVIVDTIFFAQMLLIFSELSSNVMGFLLTFVSIFSKTFTAVAS